VAVLAFGLGARTDLAGVPSGSAGLGLGVRADGALAFGVLVGVSEGADVWVTGGFSVGFSVGRFTCTLPQSERRRGAVCPSSVATGAVPVDGDVVAGAAGVRS
jgi:hypothetical protein